MPGRLAGASLALTLVAAGCLAQPAPEDDPLDGALGWLLAQRDSDGAWAPGFVPYMVEVAVAAGHDPQAWPRDRPVAGQLVLPEPGEPLLAQARALYAAALVGDPELAGEAVGRVTAAYDGRQFGDERLLNDDVFALFVLAAARRPASPDMAATLLANQSADGGWGWAVGGAGETDVTGMALTALAGTEPASLPQADGDDARAFLATTRTTDGGHSLAPGGQQGNCDSTVWALRASFLVGGEEDLALREFLQGLRNPDGGFAFLPGGRSNALCTAEVAVLHGLDRQARLADPWPGPVV